MQVVVTAITFYFILTSSLDFHCFTLQSMKKKKIVIFPRLINSVLEISQALTQN